MEQAPLVRKVVFVALVLWMGAMPALPHLFGVHSPAIRSWRMFHGYGNNVCAVEFFTVAGAAETPLDRCVALGYPSCAKAPEAVKRLNDREAVVAQGKAICRKLGAGTDLRVRARCGGEQGWKVRATGEQNLCTLADEPKARVPKAAKEPAGAADEEIP